MRFVFKELNNKNKEYLVAIIITNNNNSSKNSKYILAKKIYKNTVLAFVQVILPEVPSASTR